MRVKYENIFLTIFIFSKKIQKLVLKIPKKMYIDICILGSILGMNRIDSLIDKFFFPFLKILPHKN